MLQFPLLATGAIHPIPDASTAACVVDLGIVYNDLNGLPADIELLYPAQFGRNLVLTPHTYIMNGATTFTDTLYLNAEDNSVAAFVIKINGALETSSYSKVILMNGTQAKNVFWKVNGAVEINDFSDFSGTIVCDNGAVSLKKGSTINGRVYTTDGTFTTDSIRTTMASDCATNSVSKFNKENDLINVYPNPFTNHINIKLNFSKTNQYEFIMHTVLGKQVMKTVIVNSNTTIETNNLPSGIYFYKIIENNKIINSGKLIAR